MARDPDRLLIEDLEYALKSEWFTSDDGKVLMFSSSFPSFGAKAPEIAAKLNAVIEPYVRARREELLAALQKRMANK